MAEDIAQAEIKSKTRAPGASGGSASKANGHTTLAKGCRKHQDSYPRFSCTDCVREEILLHEKAQREYQEGAL
jgi:hypothetical protein